MRYRVFGFVVPFISFVTKHMGDGTPAAGQVLGSQRIMGRDIRMKLDCL